MRLKHLPAEVVVADAMLSERGRQLVSQFRKRDIPITEVASKQLAKLSETRTPQGIIALFRTPALRLCELSTRNLRTVLLCEGISDPGNLGTLFRSALAFGFDRVILLASSVEPYAPKVVRSSAGAVFGLQVAVAGVDEALRWLGANSLGLIAADGRGETDTGALQACVEKGPVALALGSEADGLSPELIQDSALVYRVAHKRIVESLNVAVAGSILMKQVYDCV